MANRETYPASQSPLTGDISGPAGATSVTVVGLQNNPVLPGGPTQAMLLTWESDGVTGAWTPDLPGNMSILLNGFPDGQGNLVGFDSISDDYSFLVDYVGLEVLVNWTHGFGFNVYVDGTGVA